MAPGCPTAQTLSAPPPSPWTLTESVGDSKLELRRSFNDETVLVTVVADEVRLAPAPALAGRLVPVVKLKRNTPRRRDAHARAVSRGT